MFWRLLRMSNGLTPSWLGIKDGQYSQGFTHRVRRVYSHFMDARDRKSKIEDDISMVEYGGMFANPDFHSRVMEEKNKEVHVNENFIENLREIAEEREKTPPQNTSDIISL